MHKKQNKGEKMNIAKAFIEGRFPEAGEPYKDTWYKRFASGVEWQYADYSGRRYLQHLAPEVYPKDLDEHFIFFREQADGSIV
jgi:hypothetical protein